MSDTLPDPYHPTSSKFPSFIYNKTHSENVDAERIEDGSVMEEKADVIQKLVDSKHKFGPLGSMLSIISFKNWASSQKRVLLYAKPTKRSNIMELVRKSSELDTPVKIGMGGSYHTWSPMFPDDGGLLINICDLTLESNEKSAYSKLADNCDIQTDAPLRIVLYKKDDDQKKCVAISPGVTTGELMSFFLQFDVCFESDVVLPTVTYGGVFSGGCHGTGKDQKSMSDWIKEVTLVDGHGELHVLDSGDDLLAAQTSLGVLGVVVEYLVEVQEMSVCRVQNRFDTKLSDVCSFFPKCNGDSDGLAQLLQDHWSIELFWFPFNSLLSWILSLLGQYSKTKEQRINVVEPLATGVFNLLQETGSEPLNLASLFQQNEDEMGEFTGKDEFLKLAEELAGGKATLNKNLVFNPNETLKWLWTPGKDLLWVRGINIYKQEPNKPLPPVSREPGVPLWGKLMDAAVHAGGNFLLNKLELLKDHPLLTPFALSAWFEGLKFQYGTLQGDEIVRTPWAVHFRDGIDLTPAYNIEFAFSIDINNPTKAVKAIRVVLWTTTVYALCGLFPQEDSSKPNPFPLNLCMDLRVMEKSNCLLCPAALGSEDHVAFIEVLCTVKTPGYLNFFKDIARQWKLLGGIPHWHKQFLALEENPHPVEMKQYIKRAYGDNMDRFKTVRDKYDKKEIFLNSAMKSILSSKL